MVCYLEQSSHDREFLKVAAAIIIAMALFRLGMEGFQLYYSWLDYLRNWVNWIELLLYLCSIIFSFVFLNGCVCPKPWQWQIGSVAVFLSWIVLIMNCRKLPIIGKLLRLICKCWDKIELFLYVHFNTFYTSISDTVARHRTTFHPLYSKCID